MTLEEIRNNALRCNQAGLKWHFHILTPSCKYNPKTSYAFALEIPEGNYMCFTENAPNELGKELAPLAHKADVLNQNSVEADYHPSGEMARVIARAEELNKRGLEWHHHITFVGCQFHEGQSAFNFVFEDPERGLRIVPHDKEPINDLRQIEPLFYSQHPKS